MTAGGGPVAAQCRFTPAAKGVHQARAASAARIAADECHGRGRIPRDPVVVTVEKRKERLVREQACEMLTCLPCPASGGIDREILLPRRASVVAQSQAFDGKSTVEESLGELRFERESAIGSGERFCEELGGVVTERRFVICRSEIAPHPSVAAGSRRRLESGDRRTRAS
jgi:hypothetical protein